MVLLNCPRVTLAQGTYTGRVLATNAQGTQLRRPVDVYLGIPFAEAPRFHRPRPIPPSDDVFAAVHPGRICPASKEADEGEGQQQQQVGLPGFDLKEGEDCLNLHVWRPAQEEDSAGNYDDDDGLPVVVYIHGGAFNSGDARGRNLGSFVGFAEEKVVAVSLNYRLGVLGFLPLEGVDDDDEYSLNLGLWDQRIGLEWVRDNVAQFGGDPTKVTIMGESAGAHSVGHHLLGFSPKDSPFNRAILESGSPTSRATLYPDSERHKEQLASLLKYLDCVQTSPSAILRELKDLSVDTLKRAAGQVWNENSRAVTWPFQPMIDCHPSDAPACSSSAPSVDPHASYGGLIPCRPLNGWKTGNGLRIPVITGFCTNEGTMFVPPCHTADEFHDFFRALIPGFADADVERLDYYYPRADEYAEPPPKDWLGDHWRRLEAAYAHYAYIAPVLQTAHYLSRQGVPVFVYQFAPRSPPYGMSNHTDESGSVCHDVPGWQPGMCKVADKMHGLFDKFIARGTPLDEFEKEWPRFVSPAVGGQGKIMVFGEGNDERMGQAGDMNEGTTAEVRELGEWEMEKIKFWWKRVLLSEGFGDRK